VNICEWSACQSLSTHKLRIHFPDLADETWFVCRQHDRMVKFQTVTSRPKKPPVAEERTANVVRCGDCGRVLEERSDVDVHERRPCPDCGSSVRHIDVHVFETVTMHEKVGVKVKRPGNRGWILDTTGGDDYTRDLEAWGKRGLTMDGEKDLYREVIELWDGTRIESTARLSDHHE
jgi:hypothetical protein